VFKSKVRYNHAGFCCALRIQKETVFGIEGYSSETVVELLAGVTLVISWVLSKWPLHSTMRDTRHVPAGYLAHPISAFISASKF
jgi:hypothetical protein